MNSGVKVFVPKSDHSFYEARLELEQVVYNKTTKEYYEDGGVMLEPDEELLEGYVAR